MRLITLLIPLLVFGGCSTQQTSPPSGASAQRGGKALIPPKPANAYFAKFNPQPAPQPAGLVLRKGDHLAICGDSITEQKMYSRVMETYLTVCVPELEITTRQFGWGGEVAGGFLARMTNDVLRFRPTIATTCYGMNDHGYRPYEPEIGDRYREKSTAVVRAFKTAGTRVIHGSPGCVGKPPQWSKDTNATTEALNLNLCQLRNIGIEIAEAEQVGFADVFWPMLVAGFEAQQNHGDDYAIAGKDGVHPGWAGSFVMAYSFLKALGLDGEIGTYQIDLKSQTAKLSQGHKLLSAGQGDYRIESVRYPFCAHGNTNLDSSIRSAMSLVPFNRDLNRLVLKVKNATAPSYRVHWGQQSRSYRAAELKQGINLAADFSENPFSEAFARVDAAVKTKQEYETRQIKQIFRTPQAKADMEGTVATTEKERAPLALAVRKSVVPVVHTLKIVAE